MTRRWQERRSGIDRRTSMRSHEISEETRHFVGWKQPICVRADCADNLRLGNRVPGGLEPDTREASRVAMQEQRRTADKIGCGAGNAQRTANVPSSKAVIDGLSDDPLNGHSRRMTA
jgi:hypothetical protein